MNNNDEIKLWASLDTTVNTGNYENVKIGLGISGVPVDCTPEYLAQKLKEAQLTLGEIVEGLGVEMNRRLTAGFSKTLPEKLY